jgi:hypothetical protein
MQEGSHHLHIPQIGIFGNFSVQPMLGFPELDLQRQAGRRILMANILFSAQRN